MSKTGEFLVAAIPGGDIFLSYDRQRKAANEAKAAQKKQTNMQIAADIQARRQEVRQARIRRANILAATQVGGTAQSSSAQSASGVVGLDTAASGAFTASQANFAEAISRDLSQASEYRLEASLFQGINEFAKEAGKALAPGAK